MVSHILPQAVSHGSYKLCRERPTLATRCIYTNQDCEASGGEDILENTQLRIKITMVRIIYIY